MSSPGMKWRGRSCSLIVQGNKMGWGSLFLCNWHGLESVGIVAQRDRTSEDMCNEHGITWNGLKAHHSNTMMIIDVASNSRWKDYVNGNWMSWNGSHMQMHKQTLSMCSHPCIEPERFFKHSISLFSSWISRKKSRWNSHWQKKNANKMIQTHLLAFSLFLVAVDAVYSGSLCDSSAADLDKKIMCSMLLNCCLMN